MKTEQPNNILGAFPRRLLLISGIALAIITIAILIALLTIMRLRQSPEEVSRLLNSIL